MIGFKVEFVYPNHVIKPINLLLGQHQGQKDNITYIRKKGNQQKTNDPIIIPSVRAARLSFDNEIFCFCSMN